MSRKLTLSVQVLTALLISALWLAPRAAQAHCDTLDGPVVADARRALQREGVTPVLKWVAKDDEAAIRTAFRKTLTVRAKGPAAQELADRYFFETLVRVHRASEGAPYTGLKPAGAVEPVVAAADKALEQGAVDRLAGRVSQAVAEGIRQRFARALRTKQRATQSVAAGREFVEAYVTFVHYVEGIHQAATGGGPHGAQSHDAH
ncbi:MAG: DUF6448 family protein [Planctomycetota bacterium]